MNKTHSAFDPELALGDPGVIRDVIVSTIVVPTKAEARHFLEDQHVIGLAPNYETVTPARYESDQTTEVQWAPSSIGYLPPGIRLDVAFLQASTATYVVLPDRIFKQAAFETVDTSKVNYRWMPNTDDPVSYDLISALSKIAQTLDGNDWPLLADAIGTALAVRMFQRMGAVPRRADIPHPGGLPAHKLKLVIDYIETNLAKPMRLDELAGIAQLSTFHFSRAFRAAMNIAPVKYVWKQRIERAKRALRTTRDSLVVVAFDCGFSSQSHFTTAFKEVTGVTPARFRAQLVSALVALTGTLLARSDVLEALA